MEAPRKLMRRMHFPEGMLARVRWCAAYPLSLRDIEAMMQERGAFIDHRSATC